MMEKVVRMEKWRSNQTYSSARAMFLLPFLQHEILYTVLVKLADYRRRSTRTYYKSLTCQAGAAVVLLCCYPI